MNVLSQGCHIVWDLIHRRANKEKTMTRLIIRHPDCDVIATLYLLGDSFYLIRKIILSHYTETCVKRQLSNRPKNRGFKTTYRFCSKEILSIFIKLPFVIFEWPFYIGFTVFLYMLNIIVKEKFKCTYHFSFQMPNIRNRDFCLFSFGYSFKTDPSISA